ncbi:MAG: hypothetical protein H6873_01135 [Hyphomicrobiaceae bacterium]|nr:hypothetical protein [Hyphomicrobiaceae bacterium]
MRLIKAAALAVTLGWTQSAFAQSEPPTLQDLSPGYDMAGGIVLDILGVRLGDTIEDAHAAMTTAFPGIDIRPQERTFNLSDNRGNEAGLDHYLFDEISYIKPDGNSDYLSVTYSTGLTGGRVVSLQRSAKFSEDAEPSLQAFEDAIIAKYGTPSFREAVNFGMPVVNLHFVWANGELVALDPDRVETDRRRFDLPKDDPVQCFKLTNQGPYTFINGRTDDYPACTAYLQVKITLGKRDDLIQRFEMSLMDYRRWYDDAVLADQWLIDQLNNVTESSTPGEAPKL